MKTMSVIILCHNSRGVSICLQSVLDQLLQNDEVILVDDHSEQAFWDKELSSYLNHRKIHIYSVSQKCGNRSYNRNFGARQSDKDILVFLDGDMVLAPGALQEFRTAHEKADYAAFIGCAHGMRFGKEHMTLHIGHEHYWQMTQTKEGLLQLVQDPRLADWREYPFHHAEFEPFYWIYYYTCICSAERKAFEKIGGFDEALVTWGSEDIDLGYRLCSYGKIGCLPDAHAVHLPHKRNLWDEQLFDRDNIRYLLDKHRVWPFELLLAVDLSAEIYQVVQQMRNELIQWNLPRIIPEPAANTLWVNVPSQQHTEDTVVWYGNDLGASSMELLGMALPCCDQFFKTAYVSSHVFSYPMIITARILQECLRVSQRVFVLPAAGSRRKAWEWEYLLQEREINRNYYLSSDTMEFEFRLLNDGTYQVVSPQTMARLSVSRSHCPVLLSAQSRQAWHQTIRPVTSHLTLVNMLERDTDELRDKLERALGITFEQAYYFPTITRDAISLIQNIPHALRDCKSSILFFVRSYTAIEDVSAAQWLKQRNVPDFLLELNGTLYRLGETQPIS